MKKLLLLAGIGAAVATATSALAATSALGPPTTVLELVDVNKGFVANFPQNRAPKFGDQGLFRDDVYTWDGARRGRRVGHLIGTIYFLGPNLTRISVVVTLPGGTLDVFGDSANTRTTTYSVIGGTGVYATARGEAVVRTLGGENSNVDAVTIKLWR
jgi:hypothetical protein